MKVPYRMDPQPLIDVSVRFTFHSSLDGPSELLQWNRVLSSLFNQMDIGFASPLTDDESIEQGPVGVLRFFDDRYDVSVNGNNVIVRTTVDYPGWDSMSAMLSKIIKKASVEYKDSYTINRISARYLNYFTNSPWMKDIVDIGVDVPESIDAGRHSIRLASGPSETTRIMHDVTVADSISINQSEAEGVILDIGVWKQVEVNLGSTVDLLKEIDLLHRYEKRLFTSLIKNEILHAFTKEWEDIEDG